MKLGYVVGIIILALAVGSNALIVEKDPDDSGGSNVSGIENSTDNAIARWHGLLGNKLQNSGVILDDDNDIHFPDNAEIYLGTGDDAYIDYTGDHMRINPGANPLLVSRSGTDTHLRVNREGFVPMMDFLCGGSWCLISINRSSNELFSVADDYPTGPVRFHIKKDGTIGIGTLNPSHKLTVVGGINATATVLGREVGINQPNPTHTLDIVGDILLTHTANSTDEHGLEIKVDAAGYGDVKGIDIIYETGAISAGEDDEVILINIDESKATGGDVIGIEVIATEGSAELYALEAGALVSPVVQLSGTFEDMDSANNSGVDALANFTSTTSNVSIFANDNDYIIIGDADKFEEIEFLLDTPASVNIKPTFEYSTGAGTWAGFSPTDGTNGLENNGVIVWLDGDIPSWATGDGSEYLIRITRTKNNIQTVPVELKVQISKDIQYHWNKDGDLLVRNINANESMFINGSDEVCTAENGLCNQTLTKQFFVPVSWGDGTEGATGDFYTWLLTGQSREFAHINLYVPSDFNSIETATIIVIDQAAAISQIGYTITTDWGGIGEAYNRHSDSSTVAILGGTTNDLIGIDLAVALDAFPLTPGDYIGVKIADSGILGNSDFAVVGVDFKYT